MTRKVRGGVILMAHPFIAFIHPSDIRTFGHPDVIFVSGGGDAIEGDFAVVQFWSPGL